MGLCRHRHLPSRLLACSAEPKLLAALHDLDAAHSRTPTPCVIDHPSRDALRHASSGPVSPLHCSIVTGMSAPRRALAEARVTVLRPWDSRSDSVASTPGHTLRCRLRQVGATRPTRSVLVVSHHLDGFLRDGSAGLLHPAASHGVRRVSKVCATSGPEGPSVTHSPPHGAVSDPSKEATRRQPHPVTRAVAPLAFALLRETRLLRRSAGWTPARTQGCDPAPSDAPNHEGTEASVDQRQVAMIRRQPGGCRRDSPVHPPEGGRLGMPWWPKPPSRLPVAGCSGAVECAPYGHLGRG
jgi:hypothetical protein